MEKSAEQLLKIDIEKSVIDYIVSLRKNNNSHNTILVLLAPIYHFCEMSDIVIRKSKIKKYIGERKTVVKDRPYTHEEISRLLNVADIRMKAIILLMVSAGVRVGSIPLLRLKHFKKFESTYKITVYENTNDEYLTFCTPECSKAIDNYLEYRKRNGEILTPDSYLIRKLFDINNYDQIKNHSKPIQIDTLRTLINMTTIKAGLRQTNHITKKKERKEVALTHSFRKFFTTECSKSKVDKEIREMLLGHKLGIPDAYLRYTDDDMFQEYQKAVNSLTINEENRLKVKVENLEREKTGYDFLNQKIESIQSSLVEILNMATKNKSPEEVNELYKSFQSIGKLKNEK
jgi:integrase